MICPVCGNAKIRLSEHSHWNDVFQRMMGLLPYRCRECRHRFYASASIMPSAGPQDRDRRARHRPVHISPRRRMHLRRWFLVAAIFTATFILFWLLLRYISADDSPPGDYGALEQPLMHSRARAACS